MAELRLSLKTANILITKANTEATPVALDPSFKPIINTIEYILMHRIPHKYKVPRTAEIAALEAHKKEQINHVNIKATNLFEC